MSIVFYQNKGNKLDQEIADLERKIASEFKKETDANSKILAIQKSINKYTSVSSYNTKMHQIERYNREIVDVQGRKANLQKKLADKKAERIKCTTALQRETAREEQKNRLNQRKLQAQYENTIEELKIALHKPVLLQQSQRNIYLEHVNVEYDVFISYASEDKEPFVEDLVRCLRERNVKVWYDSLVINWGDSLRTAIDNGLKNSTFGIIVLSENYINKGWTQYELEGLFNIEMTKGKVILPIWHNITKQQVIDFSPTLAGRKALTSASMTADEISDVFISEMANSRQN